MSGSNNCEFHPKAASPVSHRLVTKTISNPNPVKSRCMNWTGKYLKNYRISNEVLKSTSG
jgi:hypothetical protein